MKNKLPTKWINIKIIKEDNYNIYYEFTNPSVFKWLPEGEYSASIMI